MKKTPKKGIGKVAAIIIINLMMVAGIYLIITLLDQNKKPDREVVR